MKKIVVFAIMLSVQSVFAQYCETMYVAERCNTYTLSMTNYTNTVENSTPESVPLYDLISAPYLYFTYTTDYEYIQMLDPKGDDQLQLRLPNGRKIHRISTESIDKNLVIQRMAKGRLIGGSGDVCFNALFVMDEQGYIAYGTYDEKYEYFLIDIYKIVERKTLAPLQLKIREERERSEREERQKRIERNELVTRNPYAEVNNGDFGSLVRVIKTVEEYDNLVRDMTCPLVFQFDASWCNPGRHSLSYFFEKAAIKYMSVAKFCLINNSQTPYPRINVYDDSEFLGSRAYGVSGIHEGDWDDLRKRWDVKSYPSFIIVYNTKGDYISLSAGFSKDNLSVKETELADALRRAQSLFMKSK